MIAGRKIYQHPSRLDRSYVLKKLLEFHREHDSKMLTIQTDLQAAITQLPGGARSDEAQPLAEIQRKASNSRKPEPQQLGSLLVHVLARLGVTNETPAINSTSLEAPDAESGAGDR